MRRSGSPGHELVRLGRVVLRSDHTFVYSGRTVRLTPTEFRLLAYLARCPGQPVGFSDLLAHVWQYPEGTAGVELIRAHVRNLRAKLRAAGMPVDLICTHRRVGYSFEPLPGGRRR